MKINMTMANKVSLVISVAFLAFIAGGVFAATGDVSECKLDPYTWGDAWRIMFSIVCVYGMGIATTLTFKEPYND